MHCHKKMFGLSDLRIRTINTGMALRCRGHYIEFIFKQKRGEQLRQLSVLSARKGVRGNSVMLEKWHVIVFLLVDY